jgi:16S rRNA (guanine966-N2)-methyltransferase
MRIISGNLKGKSFDSPHSRRTHPMSDRVRGALFNALGDIEGLSVFDAYAGTGALTFEAVSRGASFVQMCELDKQAQKTINENIATLGLENVRLHHGNAKSWMRRNKTERFDITFADPPYDDIDRLLVQAIADMTKPGGVFVLSWPGKEKVLEFKGVDLLQTKGYGDAQLLFFRSR